MAGLLQGRPAHPKRVQCAISHPYAWESLTSGHFDPFQALIQGPRGTKMAISTAKTRPKWQASSRLGPAHPESVKCAISSPNTCESMTWSHVCPFQAPGVQKLFFICSNSGHYGALSPEKGTSPGKCPLCHITSQCEEERDRSPFLPIPGIYQGRAGSIMVISFAKYHI